jgi:hypothetical protein
MMRFASATLRASGFSQAIPLSVPRPLSTAATISSKFSIRAWFGPVTQIASIAGSATMSVIVVYAFALPTSSLRAYAAAASAFARFGLHTPSTSPSRTPIQPSM